MTTNFDIEQPQALLQYLHDNGRLEPGEVPALTVLSGGVSNRTVLVERSQGEAWVIKQALPKLRVEADWFSDPDRAHREALGLIWLGRLAPAGSIPGFLFEDPQHHLVAMNAVAKPHENWKTRLLSGKLERDYVGQFGQLLGTIHRRARERWDEVAAVFADRTFFQTLRLEPYYRFSAHRNPGAAKFLTELIDDTLATRITLVHGDYSPKNILLHQGRLVLLDQEVIHFGDPAFDLGFSLTHLLSKAHHSRLQRADFLEASHWFWENYKQAAGEWAAEAALEARIVRHALACLLARVDGRSPLEYLTNTERQRQREIVLSLMRDPPASLAALVETFGTKLNE
ncbi:MAG: phosphotransferase [Verrucomicrobiota bacterium]